MIPGRAALIPALNRCSCLAAILMIAAAQCGFAQTTPGAPFYSAQSIVHAATQTVEALAPNTIATIYGTNLAFDTESASVQTGGTLPTTIAGVGVVVKGITANMFFVSPTQINFLIPYDLTAGMVSVYVGRQGLAGPVVQIQLNSTAPGLFLYNNFVIATHLNGTLISPTSPANGGEIIVIYVAGLGRVNPDTTSGRLATFAATIVAAAQTEILLDGVPCPQSSLLYVGLAPGFAGLYQINLILPPLTPSNPELRIQVGPQISPPGTILAVN
jgi:uncharacterized protein (TIGR03437 family)